MHNKIDHERTTLLAALSEHQLSDLRAELDQQRRLRIEQLNELAVDVATAVAAGDEPRLQVTSALGVAARSALTAIDAALRRLDEGSYGTCGHCAKPIPWERLEVLPMTGLCTPCQVWESRQSKGFAVDRSSLYARQR